MKKPDKNLRNRVSSDSDEPVKFALKENNFVLESVKNELEFVKVKYEALQKINEHLQDTNGVYKKLNEVLQQNIEALQSRNDVLHKTYESLQSDYKLLQKNYEFLQQEYEVVKSKKEFVQQSNGVLHKENDVLQQKNEILQPQNGNVKPVEEIKKGVYEYIQSALKDDIKQVYLFTPLTDMVMLFLEKEHWTGAGIRNKLELTRSTLNRYMQRLRKIGLIAYSGSPRWKGRYVLTVKGKEMLNIVNP